MYEGLPVRRDSLTKAFKRFVRETDLPKAIHFHSLRHTFASWLVQDGVSLYQVGRLLGHTNTKTTEIYAHLQPETMHDVVDRIKL
jgi:site-specific recombinase XerD